MEKTGQIYGLIPKIMDDIGAVAKGRKNAQQGYAFRGIDDLYLACQAALIKNGVFCSPVVENVTRETHTSKSGSVLFYTILTMRYTFYAADGSSFEARTVGEAMDSGDKSCNKAMSAAQKYALLQVFCIPTEETKDTENETHESKGKINSGAPDLEDVKKEARVLYAKLDKLKAAEVLNSLNFKTWADVKTLEQWVAVKDALIEAQGAK